jgi:hypothetical protein
MEIFSIATNPPIIPLRSCNYRKKNLRHVSLIEKAYDHPRSASFSSDPAVGFVACSTRYLLRSKKRCQVSTL